MSDEKRDSHNSRILRGRAVSAFHHPITLLLTMLFWLIYVPVSSAADIKDRIVGIDIEAERITLEKRSIRDALREQVSFDLEAEKWFGNLNQVNAEIRKAQLYKDEYATLDSKKVARQLQALEKQRANILRLNGGTIIGGTQYSNMPELKASYRDTTEEGRLQDRQRELNTELASLYKKRDNLSKTLEQYETTDLKINKLKLSDKKDVLGELEMLVATDRVWCVPAFMMDNAAPAYYSKRKVMVLITEKYKRELEVSPGKHFDSDELVARLKAARELSNEAKKEIREYAIPTIKNEIADLQRKISEEPSRMIDISGCWVIFIPGYKNTIVNIRGNEYGYDAVVTDPGDLKHLRRNHRLFSVAPINKTVFAGSEYSTNERGQDTISDLRLLINKQGNRMDYQSDETLSMARCD